MSWIPGWDTIDGADRWHNIFFWIGIALLVLLAIAETASQFYSWRKDTLTAKADIEKAGQQLQADNRRDQALTAAQDASRKATEELAALKLSRKLDVDQKRVLEEWLSIRPKGSIVIKADTAANDARAFADEIAAFLRDPCGWDVRVDNAIIAGPDTIGMWVTIGDRNNISPAMATIHNGFEAAKIAIRHEVAVDPGVPTGEVWLEIGLKP